MSSPCGWVDLATEGLRSNSRVEALAWILLFWISEYCVVVGVVRAWEGEAEVREAVQIYGGVAWMWIII